MYDIIDKHKYVCSAYKNLSLHTIKITTDKTKVLIDFIQQIKRKYII